MKNEKNSRISFSTPAAYAVGVATIGILLQISALVEYLGGHYEHSGHQPLVLLISGSGLTVSGIALSRPQLWAKLLGMAYLVFVVVVELRVMVS